MPVVNTKLKELLADVKANRTVKEEKEKYKPMPSDKWAKKLWGLAYPNTPMGLIHIDAKKIKEDTNLAGMPTHYAIFWEEDLNNNPAPTLDSVWSTLQPIKQPPIKIDGDVDFFTESTSVKFRRLMFTQEELPKIPIIEKIPQKERLSKILERLEKSFPNIAFYVQPLKTKDANEDIISILWKEGPAIELIESVLEDLHDSIENICIFNRIQSKETIQKQANALYIISWLQNEGYIVDIEKLYEEYTGESLP